MDGYVICSCHALSVRDQAAEVTRMLALGATRPDWTYPPDSDFVVLADPDGHRFCVVQVGAVLPWLGGSADVPSVT